MVKTKTGPKPPGNRWYAQLAVGKSMGRPVLGAVASCAYHLFPGVETGAPFRVVIFHRPKPLSQNENWQGQSAPYQVLTVPTLKSLLHVIQTLQPVPVSGSVIRLYDMYTTQRQTRRRGRKPSERPAEP